MTARPVAAYMRVQAFQIDPGEVMVEKVNYSTADFHVASPSTSEPIVPDEFPFEFPFPIAGQSKKVTIRALKMSLLVPAQDVTFGGEKRPPNLMM